MTARLRAELEATGVPFRLDEPLARHTTLGVGGPVPAWIEPRDAAELARVVAVLDAAGVPWRPLGAGSNLLAADAGLDFAVVATGALSAVEIDGTRVVAGAGAFLPRLSRTAAELGLSGLEFACGIPGSAGGALVMNAGAWGSDMSRVVESVRIVRRADGAVEEVGLAPRFGYRTAGVPGGAIVTSVALRLTRAEPDAVVAVVERLLAERRATQPTAARSAGCAFKNPPGDSAGRLVDLAGLKGLARGRAEVSVRHGNFVLNRGGASAADVLGLIDEVRDRVAERFGVRLEREIVVWTAGDAAG